MWGGEGGREGKGMDGDSRSRVVGDVGGVVDRAAGDGGCVVDCAVGEHAEGEERG